MLGLESKAVARKSSIKKVFLNISQNLQENNRAGFSFSMKLQTDALELHQKRLRYKYFSVNFHQIFKKTYFINACDGCL